MINWKTSEAARLAILEGIAPPGGIPFDNLIIAPRAGGDIEVTFHWRGKPMVSFNTGPMEQGQVLMVGINGVMPVELVGA